MFPRNLAAFRLGILVAASSYFCWTYQSSDDVLDMHRPSQHFQRGVDDSRMGPEEMLEEGKHLPTSNKQLLGNYEQLTQQAGVFVFLYGAAALSESFEGWALPIVLLGLTPSFPRVVAAGNPDVSELRLRRGEEDSVATSSQVVPISEGWRRTGNSTSSPTAASTDASTSAVASSTTANASSSEDSSDGIGAGAIIGFIVMGSAIMGFCYAVVKYIVTPQEVPKRKVQVSPEAEAQAEV